MSRYLESWLMHSKRTCGRARPQNEEYHSVVEATDMLEGSPCHRRSIQISTTFFFTKRLVLHAAKRPGIQNARLQRLTKFWMDIEYV